MPDDRPLRDVLHAIEHGDDATSWEVRLARELRALAPLLREAALKIYVNRRPGPVPDLVRVLRAKADELEAT